MNDGTDTELQLDTTPLRLIKFETAWCPNCQLVTKQQLLERFASEHLLLKLHVITIEKGEEPGKDVEQKWADLANIYGIEHVPALIIEHDEYGELASDDGRAMTLKTLEKMWKEAAEALDDALEDARIKREKLAWVAKHGKL